MKFLVIHPRRSAVCPAVAAAVLALLSGCASHPGWLPSAGPSAEQVAQLPASPQGIKVLDVTSQLAVQMAVGASRPTFGAQALSELQERNRRAARNAPG